MSTPVKPGYKQTEVGVIPVDWNVKRVGSLGDVCAGKALAVRGAGKLRPYLRTKNVFDGRIDLDDVLEMPMTDAEFSRYRLRYGDLLLNEGQSLELVGRCAMYRDEYPDPCAIQNQLVRFRANEDVSASFCSHLFRRCQGTGVFAGIALQTTSVAHLGVSRFQNLQLAWPRDKDEQEDIAEALSDADGYIESLEQLIAKKQQIKQGAMQVLLTGKRRVPGHEIKPGLKTSDIGLIPEDWGVTKIGDEFHIQLGKMLDAEKNQGIPKPYLGNRAVQWGHIDLAEIGEVPLTPSDMQRFRLRDGDLLVCEGGEVGRAAIWRQPLDECYYQKALHRLRPIGGYNVRFLLNLLQLFSKTGVFANYVTQTSIAHLPKDKFETIPIPLPSTEEQSAIAAVLSEMDMEIDIIEAKFAKACDIKQGMMQELLAGRIRLRHERNAITVRRRQSVC
ncbi:restriction endonuclease subunit S [Paludisphaera borealis]|uniref:Type I restriction modification DNA specificity domain-containing protein n=1 Tax=Paludisphaera borealis TaxID=1387353 RepID=A0A1U7CI24_9BACT|nr:restriction endonuclease subunit S [Paludisphaera borealis]APW58605.1 hypothetical protein BSF38_00003 [Paludisphaera borealis]